MLSGVEDPRDRRGRRHTVGALLAVGVCAVLTGARGFTAIAQWAQDAGPARLSALGMNRVADESTFRRVFARLDADALDQILGAWAVTRARTVGGRRVLAIDGKAVRGARKRGAGVSFLVAALDHTTGVVAGQIGIDDKSSEIIAARTLIERLDLHGAVVTMDALHTQRETAAKIRAAGADFVLVAKANQKTLHARLKALPWKDVPALTTTQRGHGRRATRTIKVIQAPRWIEFAGTVQVAQLRRTVTVKGKKSVEVCYVITSADAHAADPATLAAWVQGHWTVEDRLHWVRDVTFDEDRSQAATGAAPQVMASIRNTGIAILRLAGATNIAHALRHHAHDLDRPIRALLAA
ncbi:ISAs1 family transposase [Xylanimonas allomyrinae]|uniref:ISAs1 family transposase n=2 Tax=Xylanimonas allomyrinae TaxID=2509459 RepID=A0A4P6ET97_9MICO|nr:ISAs1 family transposase [Xylanimonas allomyrinae]